MDNFKIGDRIGVKNHSDYRSWGTITDIKGNKIFALLDSTTTGAISAYSLRNDGTYVAVGWSKDDACWGGYFFSKSGRIYGK